ncbi:MAG TPA: NUDIX domain-containing protein [Natronosporangium sp.]|nr:NUDIX domain-containing protein [Natronosporangium sp.]
MSPRRGGGASGTGRDDRGEVFQRLIGSGIEFGERAEDAARREFREELGYELKDVRLRGVVEHIYPTASGLRHEIGLVFDAEVADPSFYERDERQVLDAPEVVAGWRPLGTSREDLPPLFPPGLAALLTGDGPADVLATPRPAGEPG